MGKFTLKKEERLNKEKWIQELFAKGSSFNAYPFRVVYLPHPDPLYPAHQVLISVSARNFKNAVDRNTIKRRIREGYRLNKVKIISPGKWLIAYIYIAKEIVPSEMIHKKLTLTFEQLHWNRHDEKN
jgi:ribonuclease P protein component